MNSCNLQELYSNNSVDLSSVYKFSTLFSVCCAFPIELKRRNWLIIKIFLSRLSFFLFSWLYCLIGFWITLLIFSLHKKFSMRKQESKKAKIVYWKMEEVFPEETRGSWLAWPPIFFSIFTHLSRFSVLPVCDLNTCVKLMQLLTRSSACMASIICFSWSAIQHKFDLKSWLD